ncbi:MAG TPA: PVC-type heme-binding CxxCH protein [Tepidisphaeraceae bacterium]|jgi:putative heme-binding domain-containing protein|nr:PVC-type heme-binding CxxCH protein [Tepidisphaeraceae bacterium]
MHGKIAAAWLLALGITSSGFFVATSARAAELIVPTGPRTPEDEAKAFHLPPGFEAQLVASEPEIHKPINIAFDDKGRLWVTDTIEYPFPAPEGKPTRDTVKVLSDFAPTGHAQKIVTFADNLNIPVGVLPQRGPDGHDSAIVYSIPAIWRFTDTKGQGKADQRTMIITGQAHDDTHGMTGSFNEGFDGWIYAVHGFRNTSHLKGTDGSQIEMTSGHTYRFQSDGSHLQINTYGQVNPFGMCFDPLGNLFTSDCETMPILLTLRGAYYSSFGRPHDGLGFGPDMTDHMYGASAIAGLLDYVAPQYPAEYQNMMLVGNVMTIKINRAKLVPKGSAYHGDDAPDFLVSDDHWFRPTCIKLGPDGAIYVSDFYNRIIGHYEVDLHHPGRDKERGRIWRIVYTGKDATPAPTKPFDLTKASIPEQIAYLSDGNFAIRMLAMNYLADVTGPAAVGPLKAAMAQGASPTLKAHGMWILKRLGALDEAMLKAYASDPDKLVRVHAMRVLSETQPWNAQQRELAIAGLKDADPMVQRCAADAVGQHAQLENVRPLLDARQSAPADDKHLVHTLRMALRNQLNDNAVAEKLPLPGWSERDAKDLVDVAAGATSPGSTMLMVREVGVAGQDAQKLADAFRHVGRYGTDANAEELAKIATEKFADDDSAQVALFGALQEGVQQRSGTLGAMAKAWGRGLASRLLAKPGEPFGGWSRFTLTSAIPSKEIWSVEMRKSADNATAPFISSLPLGETGTGIIRSKPFVIPPTLSFYMAGHNGQPPAVHPIKNIVRLKAVDGNEVLAEAPPPRNDLAQKISWDLSKFAGKQGYIEATDGDDKTAYAWLAFGRFEPAVVKVPAAAEVHRYLTAIDIARTLKITELESQVAAILADKKSDVDTRIAAAKALPELNANPAAHAKELAAILVDSAVPDALREAVAVILQQDKSPEAMAAFLDAIHTAPQKLQLALAKSLAASTDGAEALLDAVQAGKASPRLLQDANVRERLGVSKPANLDARIAKLTANLPKTDVAVQALINERVRYFDRATASPERGQKIFVTNCTACHTLGGVGAHVGPELNGIGIRGVPRLAEDILDPSRNVDAAFRYNTYVMEGGDVIAGIPRREEGDTLTIADSTGKEVPISKSKVKKIVPSILSLMPSNFGEIIKPADFNDLMSYLLTQVK